jgi:hypothetical protein
MAKSNAQPGLSLQVDSLQFTFGPIVTFERYDTWQHYTKVWNAAGGQKAVDVVAVDIIYRAAWLIEAKDFRVITSPPRPSNIAGLAQTVADKAYHTLAGLADAAENAAVVTEKQHAAKAMKASTKRVVLHLEPHMGKHSALFPVNFSASVLQKLKQLVRSIDPHPLVLNITNTPAANVPWTVT